MAPSASGTAEAGPRAPTGRTDSTPTHNSFLPMDFGLTDRTAFVAGASKGLGRAAALELADRKSVV